MVALRGQQLFWAKWLWYRNLNPYIYNTYNVYYFMYIYIYQWGKKTVFRGLGIFLLKTVCNLIPWKLSLSNKFCSPIKKQDSFVHYFPVAPPSTFAYIDFMWHCSKFPDGGYLPWGPTQYVGRKEKNRRQ